MTTTSLPRVLAAAPAQGPGAAAKALLGDGWHLLGEVAGEVQLVIRDLQAHQTPPAGADAVFAVVVAALLVIAWKLLRLRSKS